MHVALPVVHMGAEMQNNSDLEVVVKYDEEQCAVHS